MHVTHHLKEGTHVRHYLTRRAGTMYHIFGRVVYYLHMPIHNNHKYTVTAICNFIQDIQGTGGKAMANYP